MTLEEKEYESFIEKLNKWNELSNEIKKFLRKSDREALESVLERAKEDFPYMDR